MHCCAKLLLFMGLLGLALAQAIEDSYIILLKDGSDIDAYIAKIAAQGDVQETTRWTSATLYGVALRSAHHDIDSLAVFPEVELVEQDQTITLPDCQAGPCRRRVNKRRVVR